MGARQLKLRRAREYARLAAVCAGCGWLVLPSVCSLVLLIPVIKSALRDHRKGWLALSLAVAVLAAATASPTVYFGYALLQRAWGEYRLGLHVSLLSAEIHRYYRDHHGLPETLEELRRSRPGVPQAYTYTTEQGNAKPLYVPLSNWDEKTPVVVAVAGPAKGQPESRRAYVVLGAPGRVHHASDADLQWILKADNAIRHSLGEERVWRGLDCLMWPGKER